MDEGVNMRLQPAEIRIINAVRGLGTASGGQVLVNKGESGQLNVHVQWRDKQPSVKQADQPNGQRRVDSLRG